MQNLVRVHLLMGHIAAIVDLVALLDLVVADPVVETANLVGWRADTVIGHLFADKRVPKPTGLHAVSREGVEPNVLEIRIESSVVRELSWKEI